MEPPRPDSPQATVALTRDDVKTLSSDTRVDILKRLGERRMTVTELAAAQGLSKATVLEHLEKLAVAGFTRRIEDEKRVWVYYELADKGRRIVHQSSTRFVLLLSSAGVAALGGAAAFTIWAASSLVGQSSLEGGPSQDASDGASAPESPSSGESPPPAGPTVAPSPAPEASDAPSTDGGSFVLFLLPVVGAVCVLLASVLAWRAVRTRRNARDAVAAL